MNTTSHFPGSQPTPDSPSPAEAAEAPEAPPPAGAGRGRPSSLSWQKVFAICQYIRMTGVSDTAAAAMCGVSRSTLSRWKAADEMVECELEKARAEYQIPRLRIIDMTKRADGELDWRAQAWLVKHAAQGELGRPSPRRRLKDVQLPPTPEEEAAAAAAAEEAEMEEGARAWADWCPGDPPQVVTPAMLKALQAKRRDILDFAEREREAKRRAAGGEPAPAEPAPAPEPVDREELKRQYWENLRARRRAALVRNAQRETGEENPVIDDPLERYVAWQKAEEEKRNNSSRNSEDAEMEACEGKPEAVHESHE